MNNQMRQDLIKSDNMKGKIFNTVVLQILYNVDTQRAQEPLIDNETLGGVYDEFKQEFRVGKERDIVRIRSLLEILFGIIALIVLTWFATRKLKVKRTKK